MKRCIAIIALILIGALVFASGQRSSGSAGIPTIRYLMPGDAPQLYNEVIAEVNQRLGADKGIHIEISYIPWEV